jgi:hypothetical protein
MSPHETPDQTAQRVQELIALTERLTTLIAEQSRCFETRRPQDAAQYLEEIGRLANVYRHEAAKIRGNTALLSGLPSVLRQRLYRATEAFDAVLARQARAVAAAKFVTEGLVKAIAEEVAAQRQQGGTYGAGGVTQAAPAAATAITLNQRA